MEHLRIVSIGLRIFSIWLWWTGIESSVIAYVVHHTLSPMNFTSFGVPLIFMLGGVIVWFVARPVAALICGRDSSEQSSALSATDLVTAVIVMIGLWFTAIQGLDEFGQYVTTFAMFVSSGQYKQLGSLAVNITGVIALTKAIIGITLVMRARWLAVRIT